MTRTAGTCGPSGHALSGTRTAAHPPPACGTASPSPAPLGAPSRVTPATAGVRRFADVMHQPTSHVMVSTSASSPRAYGPNWARCSDSIAGVHPDPKLGSDLWRVYGERFAWRSAASAGNVSVCSVEFGTGQVGGETAWHGTRGDHRRSTSRGRYAEYP